MNEALEHDFIARQMVAFVFQECAGAAAIGIRSPRIVPDVSGICVGNKVEASDIDRLFDSIFVGVIVARQVAFELHPVQAPYLTPLVSINEKVLFGTGNVIENEALAARICERVIEFQPAVDFNCLHVFRGQEKGKP